MFWRKARLVAPDRFQSVTLRMKQSMLDADKSQGKGRQTGGPDPAGDGGAGWARQIR